jgi:hypothetical protein
MRTGCISRSCHLTRILFLLLAGNGATALLAQARPDLSGVWKLRSTRARYSEIWTVKQTDRDIRIRMDITDDQLGDRVLDFEASIDGEERKQTVIGTRASARGFRTMDRYSDCCARQSRRTMPDSASTTSGIIRER